MSTDVGLSESERAGRAGAGAAGATTSSEAPEAPGRAQTRAGRRARTVVAFLAAKRSLRSGALWGLVFGVYTAMQALAFVSTYPTQASRESLARSFSSGGLNALMGPAHDLASVAGYTAWKSVGILALIGALWALLLSTKMLRGEEDAGRWEIFVSGHTTARHATIQTLAGLSAGVVALFGVTAIITVAVGSERKVGIAAGPALYFSLSAVCGAVMFVALGAVASQLAGSRRQAAGYAGGALAAFYAVRMVANSSHGLSWLSWLTPLGWIDRLDALAHPNPVPLLLIGALTAGAALAAIVLAGTRDLGASVLPDRDHAPARVALLGGPLGLSVRLSRATLLAWLGAVAAFALLYGGVAKQAVKSLESSSSATQMVERLGGQSAEMKAYLGVVFLLMAMLIAFIAAGQVTSVRREESSGRVEHLLVGPVSRVRWLLGRTGLAVVAVVLAAVLAGLCVWAGALNQATGVGLRPMLGAAVNGAPPALLVFGVGVLAVGFVPRLASTVAYTVLAWSFLVSLLGGVVNSNHWLLDTSVFHQMAPAPAVAPDWTSALVMVALAAVAVTGGAWALQHRDLAGE
jgi:polyether ionophore transport system permease protein